MWVCLSRSGSDGSHGLGLFLRRITLDSPFIPDPVYDRTVKVLCGNRGWLFKHGPYNQYSIQDIMGCRERFLVGGRRKLTLGIIGLIATVSFAMASQLDSYSSSSLVVLVILGMGATANAWPGNFMAYIAEIAGSEGRGTAVGSTSDLCGLGLS